MFEKEKKQYAEDCKTHDRPWELWQTALANVGSLNWIDLYREPNWDEYCIYRRKQTTFVPEYYSGLNWKDAEHLIGKPIEYANYPNEVWEYGILQRIVLTGKNFYVGRASFYTYIRTCEKTFKHPTINIGGIKLPKPETVEPKLGTKYWVAPLCTEMCWDCLPYDIDALQAGKVHLTEDRAQAWANWWKTTVIDKMI